MAKMRTVYRDSANGYDVAKINRTAIRDEWQD